MRASVKRVGPWGEPGFPPRVNTTARTRLCGRPGGRSRPLLARQPIHQDHLAGVDVTRPDLQPERNPLQLPAVELLARTVLPPVDPHPDSGCHELSTPALDVGGDPLTAGGVAEDG